MELNFIAKGITDLSQFEFIIKVDIFIKKLLKLYITCDIDLHLWKMFFTKYKSLVFV